ncbi:hypothetical protein LZ554_003386 [Drepanopeziza brunnea f. sp. 'monogermtubi']|nr:hypothetical protein LZ554_003386 [Drepanopeziza brunnea f. sp. 'monogermtubi']
MAYLWGGSVAIIICLITYLCVAAGSQHGRRSRKAQQAQAMKQAYRSMQRRTTGSEDKVANGNTGAAAGRTETMKISQLWIYPIKSLRGCQVPAAMLTREGFYLDRRFMLLKDHGQSPPKLENMAIAKFARMCLFHTSIRDGTLIVTYRPPGSSISGSCEADSIEIPLDPESYEGLRKIPVVMHGSPTTGYDMGERYGEWLSKRFGFKVILAFWGGNPRPVLGNLPIGKSTNQGPTPKHVVTKFLSAVPFIGAMLRQDDDDDDDGIAFNDCAPYLVISDTSVADVTTRLPADVEMDLTKFRANIVVAGSPEPYAEDYWGELAFGDDGSHIILTANCGRCKSLNVDYHTGESGTGRDGEVLKLLQSDRRVDPGMKYSPIFGRYGFVGKGDVGRVLRVGDGVAVTRRNEERTKFYWPGISTPWE